MLAEASTSRLTTISLQPLTATLLTVIDGSEKLTLAPDMKLAPMIVKSTCEARSTEPGLAPMMMGRAQPTISFENTGLSDVPSTPRALTAT